MKSCGFCFAWFGRDSVRTYHLAALGAARVGLARLDPNGFFVQVDPPTILVGLSIDPTILVGLSIDLLTILVGLSLQMLGNPTGLLAPAARLLTGLLVPWFEPPRMLHNFTSNLANSIASLLQVVVIMITISNVIITLVEVEVGHSSGDLSRRTNFVIRQTFFFCIIIFQLVKA